MVDRRGPHARAAVAAPGVRIFLQGDGDDFGRKFAYANPTLGTRQPY